MYIKHYNIIGAAAYRSSDQGIDEQPKMLRVTIDVEKKAWEMRHERAQEYTGVMQARMMKIPPTSDIVLLARSLGSGIYLFVGASDEHGARFFSVMEVCGDAIYDLSDNGSDISPIKLWRGGEVCRLCLNS